MLGHEDRTITVELSDDSSHDDDLRLDDFLEQLRTFKAALRETERLVSGGEPSLYFRIKRLQKNSPPTITLEAVSDSPGERSTPKYASRVVRTLAVNLCVIGNKKKLPKKMDYQALGSYKELAAPAERRHLSVRVKAGNSSVTINQKFRETVEKLSGADEFSTGSISGKIEAINLHDRNRQFQIFPTVGPTRIVGTFRTRDRAVFASAVDKYVTVYGRLRYKTWDPFPYAIHAESVEIHDLESMPTLADLKGIAPNATGVLSGPEFVDRIHDDW